MARYMIQHAGTGIARYEADDACEALLKFLTDRYRASLRSQLVTTADGCQTSVEVGDETFTATLLDDD